MLNFIIFFLMTRNYRKISLKEAVRKQKFKTMQKAQIQKISLTHHKCAVCGRTEKDDPNLEFPLLFEVWEIWNIAWIICIRINTTEEELKDSK